MTQEPQEPTVLDYVKSLLRGKPIPLPVEEPAVPQPAAEEQPAGETLPEARLAEYPQQVGDPRQVGAPQQVGDPRQAGDPQQIGEPQAAATAPAEAWKAPVFALIPEQPGAEPELAGPRRVPWRSVLAVVLALVGQVALNPVAGAPRTWQVGTLLYVLAAGLLAWATWVGEWAAAPAQEAEANTDTGKVRPRWLYLAVVLIPLAFLALRGNKFTTLNLVIWGAAVFAVLRGLWLPAAGGQSWRERVQAFWRNPRLSVPVSRWTLALLLVGGMVIFYRVYQLNQTPSEMVSDQAEKLLDIWDVLHGETRIFFPRNTGREALQMYLTAAIIQWLGTGYSYLSLKLGTVLAGLLTLPYIYLLGKEVGNRRVGLLALLLAGVAYWPNVLARVGLRFPFYPLFVAPALYYLLRGLRTRQRNDFILCGVALGVGLHGYTPIRILPVVILLAFGLYLVHKQASGQRKQALGWLTALVLVSLVIFLPLASYASENADMFGFRAFSRLGTAERPLPGPAGVIFLSNLGRAMAMFAWDDGDIWVHSVPHRPALDTASAALFYLGLAFLLVRYLRRWHWQDLFLILAVPMLMMPSILSLAFPAENPALNRAGGAYVVVFVIVALALDALLKSLERGLSAPWGRGMAWGVAGMLLLMVSLQNYDLVFRQYRELFTQSAWNTTEMGQVIGDFADSVGNLENAWVLAYPYWVDTRLVGMNAGNTTRDYAIWPDQLQTTVGGLPGPKLFLVNLNDQDGLLALYQLYPQGVLQTYHSEVGKDFGMFLVVPAASPKP